MTPEPIRWQRNLTLCTIGVVLIFAGALVRGLPPQVGGVIVGVGAMIAALGWTLWVRALIRRHGPGRCLLVLAGICVVLALLQLVLQSVWRPSESVAPSEVQEPSETGASGD